MENQTRKNHHSHTEAFPLLRLTPQPIYFQKKKVGKMLLQLARVSRALKTISRSFGCKIGRKRKTLIE